MQQSEVCAYYATNLGQGITIIVMPIPIMVALTQEGIVAETRRYLLLYLVFIFLVISSRKIVHIQNVSL